MGIEPTLRAWEAPVLPLNYTRITHWILAVASLGISPALQHLSFLQRLISGIRKA